MAPNFSPPANIQLHYSYLLCRKDGAILPLVAIDHIPSAITVLPPVDGGIALVQEIPLLPSSCCLGVPEMAPVPAVVKKTKDGAVRKEGEEITGEISGLVIQPRAHSPDPSLHSSSPCSPAPFDPQHIRDESKTRKLFPGIFCPPPNDSSSGSSSSTSNGLIYTHPHSRESSFPNTHSQIASPFVVRGSKQCPTFLPSGTCLLGSSCPIRHGLGRSKRYTRRVEDNASADSSASSSNGTSYTSIGNHDEETTSDRDATSIGAASLGDESITKSRGKKLRSTTEPCAYFRRSVGCKRGKDCFYVHESKDGSTNLPGLDSGDRYNPINSKKAFATNSTTYKKLEGKWRRIEPSLAVTTEEEKKGKEIVAEDITVDEKTSPITCPTPGRSISATDPAKHIKTHCTFFLRFGECDYWPACKFSHERPEGTAQWRESKPPPSPKTDFGNVGGGEVEKEEPEAGGEKVLVQDTDLVDSDGLDTAVGLMDGIAEMAKAVEEQLISLVD